MVTYEEMCYGYLDMFVRTDSRVQKLAFMYVTWLRYGDQELIPVESMIEDLAETISIITNADKSKLARGLAEVAKEMKK